MSDILTRERELSRHSNLLGHPGFHYLFTEKIDAMELDAFASTKRIDKLRQINDFLKEFFLIESGGEIILMDVDESAKEYLLFLKNDSVEFYRKVSQSMHIYRSWEKVSREHLLRLVAIRIIFYNKKKGFYFCVFLLIRGSFSKKQNNPKTTRRVQFSIAYPYKYDDSFLEFNVFNKSFFYEFKKQIVDRFP